MRPRSMQDVLANKDASTQQKGSRSSVRIRGLRDVMASQKVSAEAVPASNAQRLSEIAWLERELERLEREGNILDANHERVRNRLAEFVERRELLLRLMRESLGVAAAEPTQTNAEIVSKAKFDSSFDTFALEYGRPTKARGQK